MTTRADLAAALTWLRQRAGLTVRELARQLNSPPGTLGDYFSGRHIPSTPQRPLLRRLLAACGVTEPDDVEEWIAAVRRARSASDRSVARTVVPYRGLAPFEPEDAALFFGRADDVAGVLDRIARLQHDPGPSRGVLVVFGPSGSGKTSLLRAGVVATLRATNPDGCAIITPGSEPLDNLAAALRDRPQVLVVDQFEELFTGDTDQATRRSAFFTALADRDPQVVVVAGIRADFYADAAREPALSAEEPVSR